MRKLAQLFRKLYFKICSIMRNEERFFIMTTKQIHWEHITILNAYEPNIRASNCSKVKWMDWKKIRRNHNSHWRVQHFPFTGRKLMKGFEFDRTQKTWAMLSTCAVSRVERALRWVVCGAMWSTKRTECNRICCMTLRKLNIN